jgi:PAS domain S-box-containing protein
VAELDTSVIFRSRLHYGPPLFGYALSFALIAVSGFGRVALMRSGETAGPFVLFYPAIAAAAFLGGTGPGFAAITGGAFFSYAFFPTFPGLQSWVVLSVLGPVMAIAFGHLREIREKSAAIAEESARLRLISDQVSDWIFLVRESGEIEYANLTACRELGYAVEELSGRQFADCAAPPCRSDLRALLTRSLNSVVAPAEITFERRDGSTVLVEAGCTAVRTSSGAVIHIAARDITERKEIDRKLREARQWESLGVLAGGMAHDFNNLLTSILGNASLARESLPSGHPVAALLQSIEEAGNRSAELIRMMLATSGYRSRYNSRLALREILVRVLQERPVPPDIHVSMSIEADEFEGDRASMETLLRSLISNAAESYREGKGDVRVVIRSGPAPELPRGSFEEGETPSGECLGIIVEDQGSGMEADVLERAFDPFYTTRFTGRGLGLPAVRGIVRSHFGKLWLSTAPGRGTRVEVWLPRQGTM